jgi:hypothetical protein
MPLQNRITPNGDIISTTARGAWLGNRGVIHNAQKQTIKPFNLKAWITCALEFRGRHREVMMPNRWTELFFLDEATAFSAGHRPCFQCRYKDHKRFKSAWLKGNPQYGFTEKTPVSEIDKILHAERINKGEKVTYNDDPANLPDCTFILIDSLPYVISKDLMYQWTPIGYEKGITLPTAQQVEVLTPRSIVNMLRAGYEPQISAN